MKKILLVLALFFLISNTQAQLVITPGAQFSLSGNAQLTLSDIDFVNNGNFLAGNGNVLFTGNTVNIISGSQNTTLYDLAIGKTAGGVRLQVPLAVSHQVTFTSGLLDLNANDLNLGNTGVLSGEQELSHITGANGGNVISNANLLAPAAANPGNLGIIITSSNNLGNTIIKRGHQSQTNNNGGGNSIIRYYDILPANNTALNATLRLQYLNAELNGIDENDLVMWQKESAQKWTSLGFDARNATSNYVEKNSIGNFTRFTLSSLLNALPVKFVWFTVQCNGGNVLLSWQTAQEQNSKYYLAEKSVDGISWSSIGSITAAGNTTTATDYHFTDNNANAGDYYRIAEYDADGNTAFTNALRSNCTGQETFSIWPNPASDVVYINMPARSNLNATIQLFDSKAALVKQQSASLVNGNNLIRVSVNGLAAGLYYIHIIATNGETQIKKFLKD